MTTAALDQRQLQIFAEKHLGIMNNGVFALLISLGHNSGLFDTMAKLPPCTSRYIAHTAGLDETTVWEWLAVMVDGRLVRYDPTSDTYSLQSRGLSRRVYERMMKRKIPPWEAISGVRTKCEISSIQGGSPLTCPKLAPACCVLIEQGRYF